MQKFVATFCAIDNVVKLKSSMWIYFIWSQSNIIMNLLQSIVCFGRVVSVVQGLSSRMADPLNLNLGLISYWPTGVERWQSRFSNSEVIPKNK